VEHSKTSEIIIGSKRRECCRGVDDRISPFLMNFEKATGFSPAAMTARAMLQIAIRRLIPRAL